ncbi:hypothetical protein [Flavobacterium beibuense]|uniref:Lipoprotein n=1 Tax=Flavobacterium beibuense TaxID=657326 RepID=A0A444WD17_9FLAO|nr:hypothetical protein [Flavobacterium beibuense]RYJ43731.1 hypothetical protein NU09_1239 [Flavobacterium beibuense]
MKKILLLLILTFLSCSDSKEFKIKTDTIKLNIEGKPTYSVKYKNTYYSVFAIAKDEPTLVPEGTFCVFNKRGKIYSKTQDKVHRLWDSGIYVENDSIVFKENTLMPDAASFYWDSNKETWLNTPVTDDGVFEDDNYYVYALDYGEWGAATIFKDKKTGVEYDADILLPKIYKIQEEYYLVTNTHVLKVADPHKLNEVKKGFYYNEIKTHGLTVFNEAELGWSLQGVVTIYKSGEEAYYYRNFPEFYIAHSFVYNNELLLIMMDGNKMYLARINNGMSHKVMDIGEDIFISRTCNSYRNAYLNEVVSFYKKQGEKIEAGLLEIKDNTIYLHYIKTKE